MENNVTPDKPALYVVTFGSYDDAYTLDPAAGFATESEAKIAAAEHCLDMIERHHRMPDPFTIERYDDLLGALQESLAANQPEPAESLDELRARLRKMTLEAGELAAAIESAEADERDVEASSWTFDLREHEVSSTVDGPDVDEALVRLLDQKGTRAVGVCEREHVEEMNEDDPIAIADEVDIAALRTAVQATGALLKVREMVAMRHGQAWAHWQAMQHGKRGEHWAAAREVSAELGTLLAEVNAVIERELG